MKRLLMLGIATALLVQPSVAHPEGANEEANAKPTELKIHAGTTTAKDAGKAATLIGPDARIQLVVTGTFPGGALRDLTGGVKFSSAPEGVISIDKNGRVAPLKDGKAKIRVEGPEGLKAEVAVTVERFSNPPPVNFPNKVVPIFTKLGCNSGGCHGKSGGQNGFRLSLLGFEPQEDYEYLVKESFGRRIFPSAPEHSLLLLKSTGMLPHGGGEKLKKDSDDYRRILRWIQQGMPYGRKEDPTVTGISVFPRHRVMAPDGKQQLIVVAHYSDSSIEDVTHAARYEANNKEMAEITVGGKVRLLGDPGDVAVMIRYQDRVSVFEATVPLGAEVKELPVTKNFVDQHVFEKLKMLGLPPSPVCDDATFLRRVTLDIAGRLPTADEARKFLADKDAKKRDTWVDRLLASQDYIDYFTNKWTAVLRNKRNRRGTYEEGNFAFYEWVRNSLATNKPYDQFVREVLTASGEISQNPTVGWYRQVTKDFEQTEDVAQLFLGVRIKCARCHHHPFEKWSQNDYYGLVAFFSRVATKDGLGPDEKIVYHRRGAASAKNPKNNQNMKPTGLGGKPMDIPADVDPRTALADWMARKDNPFFAPMLVNRYWKHFFGRGIVDPEDDMRETNPPANKKLLNALAKHFIDSGFDLKEVIRAIAKSNTYQLTSLPNEHNIKDSQSFSRYYPKRLNAEVLLDAIDQFNGTETSFTGLPQKMRAVQIPDHGGVNSYFLTVFGRPAGASACECERSIDASLAQSLHLVNSRDIHGKMTAGVARQLAQDSKRDDKSKVEELYLRAFSRPPSAEERKIALEHLKKFVTKERQKGYEDIVWALINTKEFLFNH